MTYKTIMVHLVPGGANAVVLRIALDLADRFDAGVIGIAACQPIRLIYPEGGYVPGALVAEDRSRIEDELDEVEVDFRNALETRAVFLDWRSAIVETSLAIWMEAEARSADLLVTADVPGRTPDLAAGPVRRASAADLVMQVGRPVLVVPDGAPGLDLDRVVVGWTDTREARRAISDALPILRQSVAVIILEIAAEEDVPAAWNRVRDVSKWLLRHGIGSETEVVVSSAPEVGQLDREAGRHEAGLVVAGAYGHNRAREWALGGVTSDLLRHSKRCLLLSH